MRSESIDSQLRGTWNSGYLINGLGNRVQEIFCFREGVLKTFKGPRNIRVPVDTEVYGEGILDKDKLWCICVTLL